MFIRLLRPLRFVVLSGFDFGEPPVGTENIVQSLQYFNLNQFTWQRDFRSVEVASDDVGRSMAIRAER